MVRGKDIAFSLSDFSAVPWVISSRGFSIDTDDISRWVISDFHYAEGQPISGQMMWLYADYADEDAADDDAVMPMPIIVIFAVMYWFHRLMYDFFDSCRW